jgi:CubicO group peptidase (beta-lactamase class C family)
MEHTLVRATPESLGIPSNAVLEWVDELERIAPDFHSLMILRHGRVAAEGWWAPAGPDLPHRLYSVSKSFTSTAVGMAISAGHFGLDDSVLSFFPDEVPAIVGPNLAAMKVRHLLSMCTGHDEATVDLAGLDTKHDLVRRFLALPVPETPGSRFVYNTPASYMLSAIVQKRTGLNLVDYLEPRLFEPLGIDRPAWESDALGVAMGGFGLELRTEEIARFGQLYLQKGVWRGRRLIGADWVEAATSVQIETGPSLNPNPDWRQGYGYQFWRGRHDTFRADGAFGQFCIVVPGADLVVAMTAGIGPMHLVTESLWNLVLARLAPGPLPEDEAAQQALATRLSALRLTPEPGAAASPLEADFDCVDFAVDPNPYRIGTLRLEFSPRGGRLAVRSAGSRPRIVEFGRGEWRKGTSALVPQWRGLPLVASGAWPRPDCLELDVCFYTDALRCKLRFDFAGPRLQLAISVSVSFGPTDLGVFGADRVAVRVAAPAAAVAAVAESAATQLRPGRR